MAENTTSNANAAAAAKAKGADWAGDAENRTNDESGAFVRDTNYIDDRIVSSVEPGSAPQQRDDGTMWWPVEPHRYRLIAARACPWAHRTIIARRIYGLEDVISLGLAGPTHDKRSWTFDLDPDGVDPVLTIPRLQDAYFARFPDYPRGITVPAIVEEKSGKVVTNKYSDITIDFGEQWKKFHREGAPDLYPEELREDMRPVMKRILTEVNNGVYRCGFATSQKAYEEAYDRLWVALDWLEERLTHTRYLMGDHITEADVRLFTTLIRFDAVYHSHFKASRNKITEMPSLWGYLRDLFQTPGFGDTCDFTEIKQHYYIVHKEIDPTQIVPVGPDLSGLVTPHDREKLGGSPFAPGTTLPGPIVEVERVKNPEPWQAEFFGWNEAQL